MRIPVLTGLLWRAALKTFHPVPPSTVNIQPILEAIQLAPSGYALHPYHIHVVTDADLKTKMREVSYNQSQVTDCSHLLVFAASNNGKLCADRFIQSCAIDQTSPDFASFLHRTYDHQIGDAFLHWATNQAYIGLGLGLAAAAELKIGSCPMSGFVPQDVKRLLSLPEDQFPVAYLALGSTLDDEQAHAESRKVFPRRRLLLRDLVKWHGDVSVTLFEENKESETWDRQKIEQTVARFDPNPK